MMQTGSPPSTDRGQTGSGQPNRYQPDPGQSNRGQPDSGQPNRGQTDSGQPNRGQTLPDFAVGISIFLLALAFITLYVPQMLLPFDDQEQPIVADRISSDLGGEQLTAGSVSSLDESATREFFNHSEPGAREQLGISGKFRLNITLLKQGADADGAPGGSGEILCHDDDAGTDTWIGECDGTTQQFSIGTPVTEGAASRTTARRTLYAGNQTVVLEVVVW